MLSDSLCLPAGADRQSYSQQQADFRRCLHRPRQIGAVTLSLLGFGRNVAVAALCRPAFRTAWLAFAAVFVTGALQFAPIATEIFYRPSFRAKLAVLAIALATLAWLHTHVRRRAGAWDAGEADSRLDESLGRAVAGALADRHRGPLASCMRSCRWQAAEGRSCLLGGSDLR
jgi:hypothetical protein